MESQYIKCTARGDRWQVAKIAAARNVPFVFVKEIRVGDFVETVGRVELEYRPALAAWIRASNAGELETTLLAYAVTNDARRPSGRPSKQRALKRLSAPWPRRPSARQPGVRERHPTPAAPWSI